MIITAAVLSGRKVTEHHGLVSGEAVLGANTFRDFFAGIRGIVGGQRGAYEQSLRKAKTALCERKRPGGSAQTR